MTEKNKNNIKKKNNKYFKIWKIVNNSKFTLMYDNMR